MALDVILKCLETIKNWEKYKVGATLLPKQIQASKN